MKVPHPRGEGFVISQIYFAFTRYRKEARERYGKTFSVGIDDPCIDEELERVLQNAAIREKERVTVPARLLLALLLRPRGNRGAQPKERRAARAEALAIDTANRRWAELIADGQTSKRAKYQAAEEARDEYGIIARIGVETIKSKMRLKSGKAAIESR